MRFLARADVIRANMSAVVTRTQHRTWLTPLVAILAIFAASGFGGWVTTDAIRSGWYDKLEKSALNPPNFVFGPVWTTLYVLMGIALIMTWREAPHGRHDYKIAFGNQITLNLVWSIAFFGWRSPEAGVVVIALLIASIIWNMIVFARFRKTAAWLLAPYLAWVCFATYLNVATAILN